MKWSKAILNGESKEHLGQNTKALKYYKEALRIARIKNFKKEEAFTFFKMGVLQQTIENRNEAVKYYKQGLHIAQEIGDKKLECQICYGLGGVYNILGQYDQGAELSKHALEIALRLGDSILISDSYSSLGNSYASLFDYEKSIKCHKKAIDICKPLGDVERLGKYYTNLSTSYQSQGKLYDAIHFQEKSMKIADNLSNKYMQAASYNCLGNIYYTLNNRTKAADYYNQCLTIAKEINNKGLQELCYGNLGNICKDSQHYKDAISQYLNKLEIAKELNIKKSQAEVHLNIGSCYFDMNQYHNGMEHYNNSLAIAKEINAKHIEAAIYYNSAFFHAKIFKNEEAIRMSKKALDIALSIDNKEVEWHIYDWIGGVYHLMGKCNPDKTTHAIYMSKSAEFLHKGLEIYDYLITHLRNHDQFKISMFDQFIKTYKLLTSVLIDTQQTQQALLVSDRGRARALADSLTFAYGITKEEYLSCNALTYSDVKNVFSTDAFTLLHYSLLDECLAVWILDKDSMTFKEIDKEKVVSTLYGDKKKEDNTVICFFVDTVTRAYAGMKIKDGLACENRSLHDTMSPTDQQCNVETESVSRDGSSKKKAEPDLHSLEILYNTLIAPVLPHVQHEEIVIVPDGEMYTVPFAALKDPNTGKYLSENKRIRLVPSMAVLKLLQDCPVDHHSQHGALVVGNPSVGEVMFKGEKRTFSELQSAGVEVMCISNLLEDAARRRHVDTMITSLTEKQATKDAVLAKMKEGVAIIHIAAHGSSDTGEIVLAPVTSHNRSCIPEEQDYLLTMKEVQEAGVKAQLVVLSCCHSGRGEIRAEGMIGLSRAFLAAGARAVVASLWAISDEVTQMFMVSFYDNLCKGDSASVSLDKAMKDIRSEPDHRDPKFWAPFFLIGDDVTINSGQ